MSNILQYVFWLLPAALQTVICWQMNRRHLRKDYPIFFNYSLFQVISAAGLFIVYHASATDTYFYTYWTTSAISAFLGFAVIYEVFVQVFKPYAALKDLAVVIFRWAALVMLLVATVVAFAAPGNEADVVIAGILSLERSVRVMQCGLLLFLLMFSTRLGVSWRNHLFGIAAGFGMFAAVDLILFCLRSGFGDTWTPKLSVLHAFMYSIAVTIWTGYVMSAEPARRMVDASLARPMLDRWNQQLVGARTPAAAITPTGFMPAIQDVVERVMARDQVH